MAKISEALEETLRQNFDKQQQSKSADMVIKWLEEKIEGEDNKSAEHLADILKATNQISKANLIYMQAIDIGGDSLQIKQKMLTE